MGNGIQGDQLAEGVVTVLRRTVVLTDAQIKALPTTAVEILPAAPEGKIYLPTWGFGVLDNSAGAYSNVGEEWPLNGIFIALDGVASLSAEWGWILTDGSQPAYFT